MKFKFFNNSKKRRRFNNNYENINLNINDLTNKLVKKCNKVLVEKEDLCQCFDRNNYPSSNINHVLIEIIIRIVEHIIIVKNFTVHL